MPCHKTQGQRLAQELKRRWMSYADMLALGISLCPWKRAADAVPEGYELKKRENAKGLIEWRFVKREVQEA